MDRYQHVEYSCRNFRPYLCIPKSAFSAGVFLSLSPPFNISEAFMLTQSLYSVTRYDVSAGRLILEHGYPTNLKRPATVPVDINLLLETIKANEIQVGSWLNVLGYVREQAPQQNDSRALVPETEGSIYIEAVMVFSAGAIHVGDYERILRDSLEVDRRVNKPA
jgi:telomere-capping CST complex subunit Ten1